MREALGRLHHHTRRTGRADEFGPDAVPVRRAQIPAAHGALAGSFDGGAVLDRNAAACAPHRWRATGHTNQARQRFNGAGELNGSIKG